MLAYGGKLTLFIGDGERVHEVACSDTAARLEALEAAVRELQTRLKS